MRLCRCVCGSCCGNKTGVPTTLLPSRLPFLALLPAHGGRLVSRDTILDRRNGDPLEGSADRDARPSGPRRLPAESGPRRARPHTRSRRGYCPNATSASRAAQLISVRWSQSPRPRPFSGVAFRNEVGFCGRAVGRRRGIAAAAFEIIWRSTLSDDYPPVGGWNAAPWPPHPPAGEIVIDLKGGGSLTARTAQFIRSGPGRGRPSLIVNAQGFARVWAREPWSRNGRSAFGSFRADWAEVAAVTLTNSFYQGPVSSSGVRGTQELARPHRARALVSRFRAAPPRTVLE